ncbi:phage baseplate assembly protein V [Leptolyngbya sp. AN03gr2]
MNLWSSFNSASERSQQDSSQHYGVVIGEVTNNQDEAGLGRVKLKLPWLSEEDESNWARVVTPMAGANQGIYFLPEVGDEVLVAFEQGNIEFPYVLGALWNGQDSPPTTNEDGNNNQRLIKSRSGHEITLDDTEGEAKIEIKSGNNRILIAVQENTIEITAEGDLTLQSSTGKVTLSGNGIELNSQGEVKISAAQTMSIEANATIDIQGAMINLN